MLRVSSVFMALTAKQMEGLVLAKNEKLPAVASTMIFDVRSEHECAKGMMPHALNIPLNMLEKVLLDSSAEEFFAAFGVPKPSPHTHKLVFYCQHNPRAIQATIMAEEYGFKGDFYKGGWSEWAALHPIN